MGSKAATFTTIAAIVLASAGIIFTTHEQVPSENTLQPAALECEYPKMASNGSCCYDVTGNGLCDDVSEEEALSLIEQNTCNPPFITIGNECCIDDNADGSCDRYELDDEAAKEFCVYPYAYIDGGCCLDTNEDGLCDSAY